MTAPVTILEPMLTTWEGVLLAGVLLYVMCFVVYMVAVSLRYRDDKDEPMTWGAIQEAQEARKHVVTVDPPVLEPAKLDNPERWTSGRSSITSRHTSSWSR